MEKKNLRSKEEPHVLGPSAVPDEITQSKCFRIGYCHTPGRKTDSNGAYVMEDVLLLRGNFREKGNEDLIGVFDGHGGSQVAEYTAKHFASVFQEELRLYETQCFDDLKLIADALEQQTNFIEIDPPDADLRHKRVAWAIHSTLLKIRNGIQALQLDEGTGTTALVTYFRDQDLYIANIGDTRCVAGKENGSSIRLSVDHTPELDAERERVEKAGARVYNFSVPRVEGILAVTRALGDFDMEKVGVIFNPHIRVIENFREKMCFVTLATDGLWDQIHDDDAVDVVWSELTKKIAAAPPRLDNLMFSFQDDFEDNSSATQATRRTNTLEMAAAKTLVDFAFDKYALDNVSVVVVSWPGEALD